MKRKAATVEEYLAQVPEPQKSLLVRLRQVLRENLPAGFEEQMSYGMIGYVVPRSLYPAGYHANPEQPLPFIHLGAQKHHIALYHMGLYAKPDVRDWFVKEYRKRFGKQPDMGKSCIRFRKEGQIPFDLIAELARKMSAEEWIETYRARQRG